jgi:hypothetical protein
MVCPICGKTVTFPAVPPGGPVKGLRLNRPEEVRTAKWSLNPNDILACLRQFKHWNIVLICVVPFAIVVALLVGAGELRKHFGEGPAVSGTTDVHADANAWQKMTDLSRADQAVQQQVGVVVQAKTAAAAAQRSADNLHAYYHGKTLDPVTYQGYENQRKACDQGVANAQKVLASAQQSFDRAMQNYQSLGGTIDYRQQLSR